MVGIGVGDDVGYGRGISVSIFRRFPGPLSPRLYKLPRAHNDYQIGRRAPSRARAVILQYRLRTKLLRRQSRPASPTLRLVPLTPSGKSRHRKAGKDTGIEDDHSEFWPWLLISSSGRLHTGSYMCCWRRQLDFVSRLFSLFGDASCTYAIH